MRGAWIPTPRTEFPRERADVESYARNGEFPVVVKGIETALLKKRAGKTAIRVEDAEALLKAYDELETPNAPNLMIQEYIPGGSEDIWMFDGYFDASSRCLFGVTGQKIRQHPPYAGVTSLGICRANPVVVSQTTEFMKALGYQGILDLGYKCDPRTGEYKLLDVNPRVGTTFRLFVDSHGMDVVRALYLDMTGQPVTCGELVEGRKWVVENFDLVSGFRCWRDGNLSLLSWPLSYRGVREASWFAVDDPMPFLVMVWRSLQWSHGTRFGKRDMSEEMHPVMAA